MTDKLSVNQLVFSVTLLHYLKSSLNTASTLERDVSIQRQTRSRVVVGSGGVCEKRNFGQMTGGHFEELSAENILSDISYDHQIMSIMESPVPAWK